MKNSYLKDGIYFKYICYSIENRAQMLLIKDLAPSISVAISNE
jgi:hypothetical protein